MDMLSYSSARKLIKEVEFPGDSDPTYLIALSGKSYRKETLRIQENGQNKIAAAIEIQRAWRGHCTRRKLVDILDRNQSDFPFNTRQADYPHVYAKYLDYVEWCREQGLDSSSTAVLTLEDYCAGIIQSWWRGILKTWALAHQNISAGGKRVVRRSVLHKAARIIQRTWRRHNDRKVFHFYRDLIDFKGRGKPHFMLKTINPKEAGLLDKAAGAHVRFRLGGVRFPPNIYYKIYTRRHIVDLCASSPRDYTSMAQRKLLPQERHNKNSRNLASSDNKVNWYQRHENNGWRLVSDRLFLGPLQDDVTIETSSKRQTFHHSKIQRRKDMSIVHKRKKIEWLRKMYKEGMVKAKEELEDSTRSAVDLAAEQIMSLVENPPTQELEDLDGDIDQLLSWTNGLNFDEYITEWHLSASSAFSDEDHDVILSEEDKYEVTFKAKQKTPEAS